jgi:hypothetical protein
MAAPECYIAAVEYLQRGWSVIPINPRTRTPIIDWTEFQTRRATLEELQKWWKKHRDAGVGIVTGKISRLVVVDIDSPEALENIHQWPETYRVDTPKGCHLYYTIGDEKTPTDVGNKRGIHGPGIDSRGEGGYVVAYPTVRTDGGVYRYVPTSGEPRWRPDRCLEGTPSKPNLYFEGGQADWDAGEPDLTGDWIDDALRNGVCTPGRNDTCARLAGYFAGKGVEEGTAQILLLDWARKCRPPLDPEETVTTVASVYRTAERKQQAADALASEPVEPATKDNQGLAPLQLMKFREFRLAFESQTTEWLIPGWLPKATLMILVSPPGGWKSFLTGEISTSIVTGTQFMDTGKVPEAAPVLFLQQEDPHKMTARRLALMLRKKLKIEQDAPWPEIVDNLLVQIDRDMHFSSKAATRRLEEWVAKVRPALVVLDPLYSMVDGKDHMVGAAVQMKILKGIRDRYGCSFIIVHHTSKSKILTLDRERGHGSQFLNAFVEGGYQTAKIKDKQVIVKRHFKAEEDEYAQVDWVVSTKVDPPIYAPTAVNLTPEQLETLIDDYNQQVLGKSRKQPFGDE